MEIEFEAVPFLPAAEQTGRRQFGTLEPLLRLLSAEIGATEITQPRLVVFGADHAVNEAGVSGYRATATRDRLAALQSGQGRLAAMAAGCGVQVRCVELLAGTTPDADDETPQWESGRIDIQDALSVAGFAAAVEAGKAAADAAVDEGADLLIGSTCSVGVSTPAAVLTSAVTGLEPVDTTSRGSGIDDAAWIRKVRVVRDALYRVKLAGTDTATLLQVAGGADLAALTAFIAQAAVRRTPVLIDDVPSTLCALLAARVAPGAENFVIATSLSDERGHRRLLDLLGRDPLTAWGLRGGGGGTGALLLVPIIQAVLRAHSDQLAHADTDRSADAIDDWNSDLL